MASPSTHLTDEEEILSAESVVAGADFSALLHEQGEVISLPDVVDGGEAESTSETTIILGASNSSSRRRAPSMFVDVEAQRDIRKKMLQIQQNTDIGDKQKAKLMQVSLSLIVSTRVDLLKTLMTHSFLSSNARLTLTTTRGVGEPLSISDYAKTYHNVDTGTLGCEHYQRGNKLQCSSCNAWSTCRFCHDEDADHMLIRHETRNMLCMYCQEVQPAAQNCQRCNRRMARYFCGKCKLWDDDSTKSIYHCNSCGICRVGHGLGKDYFHCDVRVSITKTQLIGRLATFVWQWSFRTRTNASSILLSVIVLFAMNICFPVLRRLSSCPADILFIKNVTTST